MSRIRLCLFVAAIALMWPGAAHAQGGWWDVLEEFSGPGPFNSGAWPTSVSLRAMCFVDKPSGQEGRDVVGLVGVQSDGKGHDTQPCLAKAKSVHGFLEFRFSHGRSDNKPLFPDEKVPALTGRTGVNLGQVLFMRQLDPAISIGAGLGMLWFNGPTVDNAVASWAVTPIAVELAPFRIFGANGKAARFVTFHFEEIAVFGTFNAKDFNALATSAFTSNAELKRSFGVDFDLLTLFAKD